MNNKTKKEIWEELQMYKKQVQQYEDFWDVKIIDEYEKHLKLIHKIIKTSSIILLIISAFLLGLVM